MTTQPTKHVSSTTAFAVLALAIITGIAAVALGYVGLQQSPPPQNPQMGVLSGVKETKITSIISSDLNQTSSLVYDNPNWTATYEPGGTFTLTESLYTTSTNGVAVLTNVTSNTPGFVFIASNPEIPVLALYAENVSAATQKIQLTFQAPSTIYSGVFEYSLYFTLTIP